VDNSTGAAGCSTRLALDFHILKAILSSNLHAYSRYPHLNFAEFLIWAMFILLLSYQPLIGLGHEKVSPRICREFCLDGNHGFLHEFPHLPGSKSRQLPLIIVFKLGTGAI
jgi:hypothetical protein